MKKLKSKWQRDHLVIPIIPMAATNCQTLVMVMVKSRLLTNALAIHSWKISASFKDAFASVKDFLAKL